MPSRRQRATRVPLSWNAPRRSGHVLAMTAVAQTHGRRVRDQDVQDEDPTRCRHTHEAADTEWHEITDWDDCVTDDDCRICDRDESESAFTQVCSSAVENMSMSTRERQRMNGHGLPGVAQNSYRDRALLRLTGPGRSLKLRSFGSCCGPSGTALSQGSTSECNSCSVLRVSQA
jgi:hypothetical protein